MQAILDEIPGANIAAFQPPSLPGAGGGLPMQFVIQTTEPYDKLNEVITIVMQKAHANWHISLFRY